MRTGRVERRERLTGSADPVVPRWHRRDAYVAATRAGWRKTKAPAANGRQAAAVSPGRHATTRGDGVYTGMTGENERERANGLDSPEGVCRRRIAVAATGGEKRGKRRRGHEGLIPGGESIYAATVIRFWRRIGRVIAEEGRRWAATTERGQRRRRAYCERRRGLGWRQLAIGVLLERLLKAKGKRWSEEGERRDALPRRGGAL
uniref:Epstein-Barr virus EBNA-1-like n=1 Tax=Oryza sativa subsp. indica TaxID=39946 RepID=A0A679BBM7_ORYSI|nr:Epstein-Barr virus EBNA-1-like [Oryza sativa Indica Group]BBD82524.1 Epstein-Barr virus EBNA-1-like [Oryza sativa Indica Group]